jgi:predicted lipoprotein with Yx(FWY)xxD motif
VALLVGAIGLVGCGSPPTPAPEPAPPAPAASQPGAEPGGQHGDGGGHAGHHGMTSAGHPVLGLYAVQTGKLGVVATDGVGHLLYRSDADSASPSTSNCDGDCIQTWIPVLLTEGQAPELLGVDPGIVGTLDRPDGSSQLTLGGWPLYINRNDDGFLQAPEMRASAGTWFAVTPTGDKARRTG